MVSADFYDFYDICHRCDVRPVTDNGVLCLRCRRELSDLSAPFLAGEQQSPLGGTPSCPGSVHDGDIKEGGEG